MDLAIIIFINVPKANFQIILYFTANCAKSLHSRPAKLTLSFKLLQSSHKKLLERVKWGKYKLCSKSAKSLSLGMTGKSITRETSEE